jgi:hypothetical protein
VDLGNGEADSLNRVMGALWRMPLRMIFTSMSGLLTGALLVLTAPNFLAGIRYRLVFLSACQVSHSSNPPLTIKRLYVSAETSSELAITHNPPLRHHPTNPQPDVEQHNRSKRLGPQSIYPRPRSLNVRSIKCHHLVSHNHVIIL